jgi:hypothetical protein
MTGVDDSASACADNSTPKRKIKYFICPLLIPFLNQK